LRVRLANARRDAIRSGRLRPGTTLPSTRILAQDLGPSHGVVVDAQNQVAAEGFIRGRPGAATTVVLRAGGGVAGAVAKPPPPSRPGPELDLRPGWPDLCAFRVEPGWLRSGAYARMTTAPRIDGSPVMTSGASYYRVLPRRGYGSQRRRWTC